MNLPIIFVHQGQAYYLPCSLWQARATNPGSDIVLLSDNRYRYYRFVKHFRLADFSEGAREFAKVYVHLSQTDVYYERFCFERWFVIRDWMRQHGLQACVCTDSDVLVYGDLTEENASYRDVDMTYSHPWSAGFTYINNLRVLEEVCDFMIRMYTDDAILSELREKFRGHRQEGKSGGVCDMTAFHYFRKYATSRLGGTYEIVDGKTFDSNINDPFGYESQDGMKKVTWINGQPYCKHLESGAQVRFCILHFQGLTKRLMPRYMPRRPLPFLLSYALHCCLHAAARLKRRIRILTGRLKPE